MATTPIGRTPSTNVAGPLNLNLTPDESADRVLELSQKLITRGSASAADLAVLLFYATGSNNAGQVPVEVQQALRDVLVKVPHAAAAIEKLRTDFMVPSMSDQSVAELQRAFAELTAQTNTLDALGLKKLLALSASQGRLSSGEVAGLRAIAGQPQVSAEVAGAIRSAVLETLVAQLEKVATDPKKASPIFQDILAAVAEDPTQFGAAEEAYYGSSFDGSAAEGFKQLAKTAPDATRLELELAKRIAGKTGKLDNATTRKLFDRIEANRVVGAEEAEFASNTNKDPDGRAALASKIERLRYVDDAEKRKLHALIKTLSAAQVATLDRTVGIASQVIAKSGGNALDAAGIERLHTAITNVVSGEGTLDELVMSTWKSARRIDSDVEAAIDGLQMGLPTPARKGNPYDMNTYDLLTSVRQMGNRVSVPIVFGPDAFLQLTDLETGEDQYFQLPSGLGPFSATEAADGVIYASRGGSVIAIAGLQQEQLPSIPGGPSYRVAFTEGRLYAFSGEPPAGQPAAFVHDPATNAWAPFTGSGPSGPMIPTGPLNVLASIEGLGLALLPKKGQGVIFTSTGQTSLPALPSQFSPESAMRGSGNQLLVTGTGSASRELYSLDLGNPNATWSRIGQDLPWLILDRGHALSAPNTESVPGPLTLSANGLSPAGKTPYSPAELERMKRLATELVEQLSAEPKLDGESAKTVLEVLETLAEAKALEPALKKKANDLFSGPKPDDAAVAATAKRWFGAGLSGLTDADVQAAKAALVAQPPVSAEALTRFNAVSRASAAQVEILLSIDPAALAPAARDVMAAELSRAFSRRVDGLAGTVIKEPEAILQQAKAIKATSPAVAAMIDSSVKQLLTLGRFVGNGPDAFRPYLATATPTTDAELRLAIAWFAKNGGGITTTELRALTALTDSDGVRSEQEQRSLGSMAWRQLAPNAALNAPRVMQGLTSVADIMGEEKVPTGSVKVDGTGPLVVWSMENNFSSTGATVSVGVAEPLEFTSTGISSGPIRITGQSVLTNADGLQPFPNGGKVTADGFDQVQSLWAADNVIARLKSAGVDIASFLVNSANNGVMVVKANSISDQNAYYSPAQNEVNMGTSNETWHLASDTDVVTHELGHFTLDHMHPNMLGSTEGGAIHEGFGDMMAALMFNDPELSEDFNPGQANPWLRNSNNDFKLSTVSTEVHDRGQVYAGFAWSMKKALAAMIGDDAEAANLMLGVIVAHPLFYPGTNVTPDAFVAAMIKGAEASLAGKVDPATLEKVKAAMVDEGTKRELIPAGWVPAADTTSPQLRQALTGPRSVAGGPLTGAELANRMTVFTARPEVQYRLVAEPKVGTARKAILQAVAKGPNNKSYPVEDGFVSVALNKDQIQTVGGRGRTLPSFDFTEPTFTQDAARLKARDLALKGLREGDARTNGYVAANIDEIFAPGNVRYEEVMSGGQRARKVITRAAEFSVKRDGSIEVSKIMHID